MVTSSEIEVILPVYNGARFLEEQVDSIFAQTVRPIRLIIRDDGSSDDSIRIIRKLKSHYGCWLYVLPEGPNLGCTANINLLLQETTASYIALSDQDDIWLPNKLENSLRALRTSETKLGKEYPIIVHTDLRLVDDQLNEYGYSYLEFQHLNPLLVSPAQLAVTNVVTGCTCLFNRSLLNFALPLPHQAVVHDWWLALVASVFGQIIYIPSCPILYRQHTGNVVGAHGLGFAYWFKRLSDLLLCRNNGVMHRLLIQLEYFDHRYNVSLSPLSDILRLSRWHRLLKILRLKKSHLPFKHGLLRTIGLYICIFSFTPSSN